MSYGNYIEQIKQNVDTKDLADRLDSGRIWEMIAEFDCEVEIESGASGHIIIHKDAIDWSKNITKKEQ